jgi:lipopolysaccharide heptosyltransferase II
VNAAAWSTARNILCVRLDNLGDVLMCTPALRALREGAPGRRLSLLASGAGMACLAHIPELDDAIGYAAPWDKGSEGRPEDPDIVPRLRARHFDGAVIFTCFSQSPLPAALLCHQAGIPLRLAHCRENPYRLLSDWVPETEPAQGIRHEVRRQLDLVAHIGCRPSTEGLSFRLAPPDLAAVHGRLDTAGIGPAARWVLMHPGATAPSRRYPPAHWARAIRLVHRELGLPVVVTGLDAEAELVRSIVAAAQVPAGAVLSLAGQLSLGELGAAIALATVVVSNNSGPAHISAALGTPLVDLYAQTNPQHTPWRVPHRVLFYDVPCRNCFRSVCPQGHHDCLEKVEPERVLAAVRELIGEAGLLSWPRSPCATESAAACPASSCARAPGLPRPVPGSSGV